MTHQPSAASDPALRWTARLLVPGIWLAVGLASAGASWANWVSEGFPITLGRAILLSLPYWLFWAAVTPLVLALDRRWPLTRRDMARSIAIHLTVALVLVVLHEILSAAINKAFFPWPPSEGPTGPAWQKFILSLIYTRWQFDLLIYGAILGSLLALRYHREAEHRTLVAAQLETQLAQAQLAALRMQLNPHFLFNTLQAISTLTVAQPRVAQRMLTRLGDLLRAVLDGGDRQEIPLSEELAFLRTYLEIEQTRFSDRLTVTFDIMPAALDVVVPSFILQPLVENAIRHGIAPRQEPGQVDVSARVADDKLLVRVTNNGARPPDAVREGVGLSTTRERLERLYGREQELTLGVVDGRAEVTIAIPLRQPHGE
jgi:two-component sensor histidine kinase